MRNTSHRTRACLHSLIDRPTSIDVARRAGVSQSTVSLVFSGKGRGRVSEATAERVKEAARELGYRPNAAAQALRRGSSRAIALLVPDMTNPFFSLVLRGAQRAAAKAGYIVILVDTQNDRHWESQSFEALQAGPVDGYLLFEVTAPDALGPDENVVLMETEAPPRPSVRFDGEGGATAAFEHLVSLGHTRIGHLGAAFQALTFQHREQARRRVLSEAGLDPATQPRVLTPISIEDARVNALVLLDDAPDRGLLRRRRDRGRHVPGRARARHPHPGRALGRRLRRHGRSLACSSRRSRPSRSTPSCSARPRSSCSRCASRGSARTRGSCWTPSCSCGGPRLPRGGTRRRRVRVDARYRGGTVSTAAATPSTAV